MSATDFLFYSLGVGFLIISITLMVVVFNLIVALKKINRIIRGVDDLTNGARVLGRGLGLKFSELINNFLKFRKKRG